VNEEVAAQSYLVSLLEGDSTLSGLVNGVWTRSMPQNASHPSVKIDRLDADDLMVVGLSRVWDDLTYLVRGIVKWPSAQAQDWTDVGAISDRIDVLLHEHEGADSVVRVHAFREESFTDETIEGGDLFLHAGGIYRVRAYEV
jgi:hypothetical protein